MAPSQRQSPDGSRAVAAPGELKPSDQLIGKSTYGLSPLLLAMEYGSVEVTQQLLKSGATLELLQSAQLERALHKLDPRLDSHPPARGERGSEIDGAGLVSECLEGFKKAHMLSIARGKGSPTGRGKGWK